MGKPKMRMAQLAMIIPEGTKWERRGKQAFVTRSPILKEVCKLYGRDPLTSCLKVFYDPPIADDQTLEQARWGDDHDPNNSDHVRLNTTVHQASIIQNILWYHGISPRVYALFEAQYNKDRVAVQLTDWVDAVYEENNQKLLDKRHDEINKLGEKYGFSEVKNILSKKDMRDGQIVDVQQYELDGVFKAKIRELYCEDGKYGKVYYQDVPEISLTGGPRKSPDRINYLALDKIDFKDKVVWDIGCAGGYFCRYAIDRGAKRVIGFDTKETTRAAFMLSNYLGYFNIDYAPVDLREGIPDTYEKPDIVFLLSMNFHIEPPERIYEAETIILEDNGKESRHQPVPGIKHEGYNYELVGVGKDHGDKNCYHLRKL